VRERYRDVPEALLLRELVRDQIGLMVNDVIETTRANLKASGVQSIDDVRRAGRRLVGFSDGLAAQEKHLSAFLYKSLYLHDSQRAEAERARHIVAGLFSAYRTDSKLMGADWASASESMAEPQRSRHIADYIAGMTDRFAERAYAQLSTVEVAEPD
jgi:dGTPase